MGWEWSDSSAFDELEEELAKFDIAAVRLRLGQGKGRCSGQLMGAEQSGHRDLAFLVVNIYDVSVWR